MPFIRKKWESEINRMKARQSEKGKFVRVRDKNRKNGKERER
jgi:hypothetical protein